MNKHLSSRKAAARRIRVPITADGSRRISPESISAPTAVGGCIRRDFAGRYTFTLVILWLLWCALPVHAEPTFTVARDVPQLFVDDALIAQQTDLRRTLHQPVKDNGGNVPLLAAAPGKMLLAYGSIVRDPRLNRYVMFVRDHQAGQFYRLTSVDGLDWQTKSFDRLEKVSLGISLSPLPPDAHGRPGTDLFSCCYDTHDPERPYKGWIWASNVGNEWEGIWYVYSTDGLQWHKGRQILSGYAGEGDTSCRAITQDDRTLYGPGDVTLFEHDPVEDRFLGLFKFYSPKSLANNYGSRARAYAFLDGVDKPFDINKLTRIQLMPAMAARNGDLPADEYYASTAWRYGSLWLGGLKIFHGRDDYPWSAAGCAFLKLVVSRDGLDWHKVPFTNNMGIAEVFIPNGAEGGNDGQNDGGYISEFSQGPLRVGDELIYYYSSSSYGKSAKGGHRLLGGGLFRARLRVDGFVSVDSGTLTTPLLKFAGQDLMVNADGPMMVQAFDASGKLLGSAKVEGDSIRHEVQFGGQPLGQVASEGQCRLRFEVQPPGQLYSFRITDPREGK